jgi:hypothetical protein
VAFDNAILVEEVLRMVAESKQDRVNPVDALFGPMFGGRGR